MSPGAAAAEAAEHVARVAQKKGKGKSKELSFSNSLFTVLSYSLNERYESFVQELEAYFNGHVINAFYS